MTHILFVCMGNICRSPMAEGVTRRLLKNKGMEQIVHIDSAGTHDYHLGEPPDARAQRAALRRGINLSGLRARKVEAADFERFDMLLAMDRANLSQLQGACPRPHLPKLDLFMRYSTRFEGEDVPDPYFGGDQGFELVLDMVEDAATGLIEVLIKARQG